MATWNNKTQSNFYARDCVFLSNINEDVEAVEFDRSYRVVAGDSVVRVKNGEVVNISTEGVVIECDYTFNPGAMNAFTFASRGLITSNDPAKVPSGIESNVWIAGMWAEDESRTAVRYPISS